jgi:hypothetical protein
MTPHEFIAKWKKADLSERSAYQQHFLDLCELLDQPKPAEVDPKGEWYTFEKGVAKTDGGKGFADVWQQGKFGWEYKGKHKSLTAAYQQLLKYREALARLVRRAADVLKAATKRAAELSPLSPTTRKSSS